MSQPKRHHWWPQTQSRFWTATDGLVNVARPDGTSFKANPNNIGVESELYTRFASDDSKDTSIEEWFANAIDGPARAMIDYLSDTSKVRRRRFRGDPAQAETCRQLGFIVTDEIKFIVLPDEIRIAIARYISALLVRHPSYLAKLIDFHKNDKASHLDARDSALDNMIYLYDQYERVIRKSVLMITRRNSSSEYLYSDGGLVVEEPWRKRYGIPFDIHAPLTPDIAVQVLPMPFLDDDLSTASFVDMTNQGVARMNRIALGSAKRFVFSRQSPPMNFICRYFGIPAPKNIGYRIIGGNLETKYDPNRN